MISVLDFARLTLLIVVLAFSVQANERAKRIVRERRVLREQPRERSRQPEARQLPVGDMNNQSRLKSVSHETLIPRDTL